MPGKIVECENTKLKIYAFFFPRWRILCAAVKKKPFPFILFLRAGVRRRKLQFDRIWAAAQIVENAKFCGQCLGKPKRDDVYWMYNYSVLLNWKPQQGRGKVKSFFCSRKTAGSKWGMEILFKQSMKNQSENFSIIAAADRKCIFNWLTFWGSLAVRVCTCVTEWPTTMMVVRLWWCMQMCWCSECSSCSFRDEVSRDVRGMSECKKSIVSEIFVFMQNVLSVLSPSRCGKLVGRNDWEVVVNCWMRNCKVVDGLHRRKIDFFLVSWAGPLLQACLNVWAFY